MLEQLKFTAEIAGVPVEIRCGHAQSYRLLRDYLTEKAPVRTIIAEQQDLERMQTQFDRIAQAEGGHPVPYPDRVLEEAAIHELLANTLLEFNVLLVHGSALCLNGEAYLFIAPSGAGKSTHARLWREQFGSRVFMINDDKPMLKVTPEGIFVYGSPWDGKHHLSRNTLAPLKALVELHRAEENHIEPLSRGQAFPFLLKQSYRSSDPRKMQAILRLEREILERSELYSLGCNMNPDAALTAYQGINHTEEDHTYEIKGRICHTRD